MSRSITATGLPVLLVFLWTIPALGQDYPNRPLRIVTSGVGGAGDIAARLIGGELSSKLGQQIIVDNRASGVIPVEVVVKSQPDGYTLLLYGPAVWLAPLLWEEMRFDPTKDLSPISFAVTSPNVLVVHPSLPVKSVRELIAFAKARPGQLNYGTAARGTSGYLAAELFKSMAGLNMVRINYKGAGAVMTDLAAGHLHFSFATASSSSAYVKSGQLRALAVTSERPSELVPGLPTVASAGLPGYASASTTGIFAPRGTNPAIINRLALEITKVLNSPIVKTRFKNLGSEVVAGSPEQLAEHMKSDVEKLGKVIRNADMIAK